MALSLDSADLQSIVIATVTAIGGGAIVVQKALLYFKGEQQKQADLDIGTKLVTKLDERLDKAESDRDALRDALTVSQKMLYGWRTLAYMLHGEMTVAKVEPSERAKAQLEKNESLEKEKPE